MECPILQHDVCTLSGEVLLPAGVRLDMYDRTARDDNGRRWTLTAATVDAMNRVGREPQVRIVEDTFRTAPSLTIAPISVELYEFPTA